MHVTLSTFSLQSNQAKLYSVYHPSRVWMAEMRLRVVKNHS